MSPEKGTISEGKDCLCNHLFLGGVLVLFRTFLVFGWCKLSIHLVISLLNWCAKEMKQHRTGYTVAATWKEEKLLARKKPSGFTHNPSIFPWVNKNPPLFASKETQSSAQGWCFHLMEKVCPMVKPTRGEAMGWQFLRTWKDDLLKESI